MPRVVPPNNNPTRHMSNASRDNSPPHRPSTQTSRRLNNSRYRSICAIISQLRRRQCPLMDSSTNHHRPWTAPTTTRGPSTRTSRHGRRHNTTVHHSATIDRPTAHTPPPPAAGSRHPAPDLHAHMMHSCRHALTASHQHRRHVPQHRAHIARRAPPPSHDVDPTRYSARC